MNAAAAAGAEALIEALIGLTDEMVAAAEADDWARVAQGDARRRALLEGAAPEAAEDAAVRLRLARLARDNRRLVALAEGARERAAGGLARARLGREARAGYARAADASR